MKIIDSETGLPLEVAEKLKAIVKKLDEEVERLKAENEKLKQKIYALQDAVAEITQKTKTETNQTI